MNDVAVIGLGAMGTTLVKLFLAKGRKVMIWNRSSDKTVPLVAAGASVAASAAEAAASSPLVVMCVYDYAAAEGILESPGVGAALAGKTLVQLTTGSPADAKDSVAWATRHGVLYLDGAIQAAPSQMGQTDTPILISGDEDAFEHAKPVLADLAGNYVYLGNKIEAAATMDLATLSYVYGAAVGFLQGALIAESQDLDVAHFGKIVSDISPSFGAFFAHEGKVIQSGDFTITESPLRISVQATQRIAQFSEASGLNTEFPKLASSLLQRADAAGLGNREFASVIKVLRT